MDIQTIKKNRFDFLKLMYETAQGNTNAVFDMHEVGKALNFDSQQTGKIVNYLIDEHLIYPYGLGGTISLTHNGIKEIEEALTNPSEPTVHFLPVNQIIIGNMHNGIIQQGNTNSTIEISVVKEAEIAKALKELRDAITTNESTSPQAKNEAIEKLNTAESDIKNGKPSQDTIANILAISSLVVDTASFVLSLLQLLISK